MIYAYYFWRGVSSLGLKHNKISIIVSIWKKIFIEKYWITILLEKMSFSCLKLVFGHFIQLRKYEFSEYTMDLSTKKAAKKYKNTELAFQLSLLLNDFRQLTWT